MMTPHDSNPPIPAAHGTYVLLLHLEQAATLTVGKLGMFPFAAGWYAYAGSAFGAGGLRGRLKHHLAPTKRLHWHIDYLAAQAVLTEIWYLASETRCEHEWAAVFSALPRMTLPVKRFGASDCDCPAHLFYCPTPPDFAVFQSRARAQGTLGRWLSHVRMHEV